MEAKQYIISQLEKVLGELGITDVQVTLEKPAESSHGDYATNISLALAKQLKRNPRELAEEIVSTINHQPSTIKVADRVEVAGPGFINFFLSKEYLFEQLQQKQHLTKRQIATSFADKKVMIEFTDPNPFKEFHIGHLYSNTVGEAISRLFEAVGAEVWRVNYQGDVGLHVAKALWGIKQGFKVQSSKFKGSEEEFLQELEKKSLEERAKFLGEAYALGATAFEEDEKAKEEIIEINKKVYTRNPEIWVQYETGKKWSLAYFETIYQRLGTKFERYYFESEVGEVGTKLVKEHIKDGIFIESEGAIIFPGKEYGLHNRVFINSLGLPTYEAKELGLAPTKYQDYPYDLSLIVTGNEIDAYFQVLLAALKKVRPDLEEKTRHISHGMVRLPEGKMSSRTGKVLTGEWLLDTARDEAGKIMQGLSEREIDTDTVAEQVGLAAIKYALLKSTIGKDIEFSFSESVSFEGNSGPYLQYTYVRTQSVLKKAKQTTDNNQLTTNNINEQELTLLRMLARYEEAVIEAAEKYAPSMLCTYLYELASAYNLFYQKHQILKESDGIKHFRLALTRAVGNTLKHGLDLLGILTPEKM